MTPNRVTQQPRQHGHLPARTCLRREVRRLLDRAVPSATARTAAPGCRIAPTTGTTDGRNHTGPAAVERFCRCLPGLRASIDHWVTDGDHVFIEFTLHANVGRNTLTWPTVNRLVLRDGKAIERVTYFDPLAVLPTLLRHPSVWWQWITR
ncbi:nuclear transport factor 2 family protein [Mycobacterium sp. NPDC050041]|uniref:nuclear transport factor 2 family protein n=1 Tax=Mycobacterium sp. NPDC050041 TaxID=3364293 RepID=UPI003C2EC7A3